MKGPSLDTSNKEILESPYDAPELCIKKIIKSSKGEDLYARYWKVNQPKAFVLISHGFSEHLKIYSAVAQAMNQNNLYVFGHDHVGHGKSSGKRAYINSIDEYVDDLMLHLEKVREEENPKAPLFLFGHSMGGMVALRTALLYPKVFDGIIFAGPLIIPGRSIGPLDFRVTSFRAPFTKFVLGIIDFINPELVLGYMNKNLITRDESVQKDIAEDDLRWHRGCKVRLLLAFVDCLENNLNMLGDLKVPFITLHGDDDGLCNVLGSRLLYEKALVEDKTLIEFPNAAHQLFLDLPEIRLKFVDDIIKWVNQRC